MLNRRYILFDLDGTLTDPAQGITKCVRYALAAERITVNDLNELLCFIGPPLIDSFMEFYGFDRETALRCLAKYRERFSEVGIYENIIYDGAAAMLAELKAAGKIIALATSKPHIYANKILEHFHIRQYFDGVYGPELDGTHNSKAEVIALALDGLNIRDKSDAIMVGDRSYDILGARENGIDAVGVRFGYAKSGELEKSGAQYIADDIDELKRLLLS